MQKCLSSWLSHAVELAQKAGQMALADFRRPDLAIRWKADHSPVTDTDQQIEAWLREQLQLRHPAHTILGEEEGGELGAEWTWVLDPIDGTRSFARGIPIFGVQLALLYQLEPVLGVIHLPALGETVAAAQGLGCRFNGQPCRVSQEGKLARALVHLHEQPLVQDRSPQLWDWLQGAQLQRNWGDCYSFVLVATGRAEAALDPRMQLWDSAPLPILLREAGGVFVDWAGQPTVHTGSAVAVNQALAPELLRHLIDRA
ncbi:MAG: inositol monophosphatase family protein [Candidatus Sericytochromatia bacterium]